MGDVKIGSAMVWQTNSILAWVLNSKKYFGGEFSQKKYLDKERECKTIF
jgi:hypothetical protein